MPSRYPLPARQASNGELGCLPEPDDLDAGTAQFSARRVLSGSAGSKQRRAEIALSRFIDRWLLVVGRWEFDASRIFPPAQSVWKGQGISCHIDAVVIVAIEPAAVAVYERRPNGYCLLRIE